MPLSLFSNSKFKTGLFILFLFFLDFLFLPSFFEIGFSLVILGCLFLVFWCKDLSCLPFYYIFILFYDLLNPHSFGVVSLSFAISLLAVNLARTVFYFDKNLKGSIIFTAAAFAVYFFSVKFSAYL